MPTISVITTVFDPEIEHLEACLRSVAEQTIAPVEHVVVDDRSTDQRVVGRLRQAAASGGVALIERTVNGGIVAASNDALRAATGDWIVLLDHDDVLVEHAIESILGHIERADDVDVIYSDHDVIRVDGRLIDPVFKPDFSPERLRQTNYITHLVAIRRSAALEAGGYRPGTDGAQDHDLLLRLMESGRPFLHLPEILAHWRQAPRSVASDPANKADAYGRGVDVVQAHLDRVGIPAVVSLGSDAGVYRIERHADPARLVSVVIPTNGSSGVVWGRERTFVCDAVTSLLRGSTHRRLEFVVVADADTPPAAIDRLERAVGDDPDASLTVVAFDEPFNFSRKVNQGVARSCGDLLLVLNDDTRLIARDSVAVMAAHLTAAEDHGGVGAVGAKLLYADGTLQHGGHVYHHEFMHALIGWRGDHPGPQRMLAIERECAGVTAAALMTTREIYDEVGGFPEDLPLHFNDVDFCLSVRDTGRRILWTPFASWHHFEGRTRSRGASMDEWRRVAGRFPGGEPTDPYANPNLVPKRSDWLELPRRSGAPPFVVDEAGEKVWA